VDFTDKAGGAFAAGGGQVGGKAHVVVSLVIFPTFHSILFDGMVVLPITTACQPQQTF
jgi:hypothetical protein